MEDEKYHNLMAWLIYFYGELTKLILQLSSNTLLICSSCLSRLVCPNTVIFLSFGQRVQTQIRLLLIRVYTVCNSRCIFWMHYSKEKPSCSTFRVITANFRVSKILGVLRYLESLWLIEKSLSQRNWKETKMEYILTGRL